MAVEEKTVSDVVEALEWRRSVKKFDTARKIEDATWHKILNAAILAPSSFGLQPWKFVVVTNQSVKEKLVAASFNQPQPLDCSHLLVIARPEPLKVEHVDRYIERMSELRNVPAEHLVPLKSKIVDYIKDHDADYLSSWTARQGYIALGIAIEAAATLGVDSGPMEGILPHQYDEILKLKELGYTSVVACAFGYRAADCTYSKMAKVRFAENEVVVNIK